MRPLALPLLFLPLAAALSGVDITEDTGVSSFQCLIANGYHFFIGRISRTYGPFYDYTGASNMKHAKAAGISNVDAYVIPCWATTMGGCWSADEQIGMVINQMRAEGVPFGMLWLDITGYWSIDQKYNQKFILQMANAVIVKGVTVGILSNYENWQAIVGLGWRALARYPLWWANYNNRQDFSNFVPFGGWARPALHQYFGDYKGMCGHNVNLNWYPDTVDDKFTQRFLAYRNGSIKSML